MKDCPTARQRRQNSKQGSLGRRTLTFIPSLSVKYPVASRNLSIPTAFRRFIPLVTDVIVECVSSKRLCTLDTIATQVREQCRIAGCPIFHDRWSAQIVAALTSAKILEKFKRNRSRWQEYYRLGPRNTGRQTK